jgi:UDP-N-acetyl-D-glucosamine/UDP-N-acetyl-D-galactosamine dehydrogenase
MIPQSVKDVRVCVVGLGYVGLPVAVEFGNTEVPTFGFDINEKKISELKEDYDAMGEISTEALKATEVEYSADPAIMKKANFLIVAVPTPIDQAKKPDIRLVKLASKTIGENLAKGSVVVFESTVYPGLTEEICIPIIEKASGLKCGEEWKIGYSPERINPGDKEHTIDKIIKVVSGMDEESLDLISEVYEVICKAGVHRAANIKTAEAAKVIENVQRDLNIALVNELSLIFERVGIKTQDVLAAAGTKWNFHKYHPGLVGGHCIGVDPYYLTYRAQELGYHPQIILAGRRINDYMPEHVAELMIRGLAQAGKPIKDSRVLVLGLTFKEDVPDMRNSKIKGTIKKLQTYGVKVFGHDPLLSEDEVESFGVEYVASLDEARDMDGIVLSAIHKPFRAMELKDFSPYYNGTGVFIDVKSHFSEGAQDEASDVIYNSL